MLLKALLLLLLHLCSPVLSIDCYVDPTHRTITTNKTCHGLKNFCVVSLAEHPIMPTTEKYSCDTTYLCSSKAPPLPAAPQAKTRGRAAPDYLKRGAILATKFKVEKMIGGGGFGQIFRATALDKGIVVAIKAEPESEDAGRMVLEQKVLALLSGKVHVPKIYYAGAHEGYNFIVMQILGKNIGDLRKMTRCKRLQIGTTVRVGKQMIEALRDVHDIGYLHRDIKPSNMCVGLGEHRRICYLVDFGMTRQFRLSDGSVRRGRQYAAFRGTMRYVSVSVHMREEQTPRDDLQSLYYTLVELSEGCLPWRSITDHDEIMHLKYKATYKDLCTRWPKEFEKFMKVLERGNPNQPDYDRLSAILRACCNVDDNADFEWVDEVSINSSSHVVPP